MRRLVSIAAALALLLLTGAASAENYVVVDGDEWIISYEGDLVAGPFNWVESLGGDHYAVSPCDMAPYAGERVEESWEDEDGEVYTWSTWEHESVRALADAQGTLLTDYEYRNIFACEGEDLFCAIRFDGTADLLDGEGNVTRTLSLTDPTSIGNGMFLGYQGEPDEDSCVEVLCADADGTITSTGLKAYYWLFPDLYKDGLWAVCDPVSGVWKCLDEELNERFTLSCAYLEQFTGELACFMTADDLYGVTDRDGNIIIPADYESIDIGEESILCIRQGKAELRSRDSGDLITVPDVPEYVCYGWFSDGGLLILATYDNTYRFGPDGSLIVVYPSDACDSLYALLNDSATLPDRLTVRKGEWPEDTMDLIDLEGNAIRSGDAWIECVGRWEDETLYIFGKHVRNRILYGICDDRGEEILPARYNYIAPLARDRYWALLGTESRLIDLQGNVLLTLSDMRMLSD